MKCLWIGCLILTLLCLPAGLPWAATLTVTNPSANLRAGPGTTYNIVGRVTRDERYEVLEERGGWYQIRLEDGRAAWLSGTLATVSARPRASGEGRV